MTEIKAETAVADNGHFNQLREDVHQNSTDMIAGFFRLAAEDLESHKAALDRLNANLEAEHAKMVEITDILNEHAELLETLRQTQADQQRVFDGLKRAVEVKMGKPPDEQPEPVN